MNLPIRHRLADFSVRSNTGICQVSLLRPGKFARQFGAWTLIEMIAVLAVLAILIAIILPALLSENDKLVADQEKAGLKSFGDAFQQYVLVTRTIPDQTTWYSAIASQMGVGTNDILYNPRQQSHAQQRVFLIDPMLALGWGTNGLPYTQASYVTNIANCPAYPVNPRMMIVSSLGKTLPTALASGTFTYFSNLWNAADGTIPSDTAWAGWTGKPTDVIVQRINLAPFFVHLLLGKYNSLTSCGYTIDGAPASAVPVATIDGYFIQGSVLGLYNSAGLDTRQILTRDSSFVFEGGVWVGSLSGATMGGGNIGVMNIGDVVQQFLAAPYNVNAANNNGNAQQMLVVSNMLTYMSNYNVWAIQYNYTNSTMKSYLIGIQGSMMSTLQGLYQSGTPNYYPTNPLPCLQ